ncbi:LysR family transcriptional regulator [Streptomyces atratus]|uniref:LysR family transcriptional regulator n=1 Tax=Streptomyces atratus TaxID=1893 RepID=UPI003698A1A8
MAGDTPTPPLHGGGHARQFHRRRPSRAEPSRAEPIVQSPLSTSVRNLEREPGAELFDRSGRRVILTEAGRALLPSARSVLAGTQAARDAVAALSGLVTGRVRIDRLTGDAPRVARDAGRAAAGRPGGRRPPAG